MARTTVSIHRTFTEVWAGLQDIDTWRGIAGIDEMTNPKHSANGELVSFDFGIDTPVGRVRDRAKVSTSIGDQTGQLTIVVDQKGVRVRIMIDVKGVADRTTGEVEVGASATSFLTKPLASTLSAALAGSIEREANLIVSRLETA